MCFQVTDEESTDIIFYSIKRLELCKFSIYKYIYNAFFEIQLDLHRKEACNGGEISL